MDRQPWDVGEAAGSKTTTDRIHTKLWKILARHAPRPLPNGAAEKIAAILREVEVRSSDAGNIVENRAEILAYAACTGWLRG